MGSGVTKGPAVGMPLSPRVDFVEKQAKKGETPMVIDAPALLDLGHGTVRYRQGEENLKNKVILSDPKNKKGYFYHARLDDYSEAASVNSEDKFKFKYINKAPLKAKGKKLYYCYGIGMNSTDGRHLIKTQYKPKGKGYVWPSSYRKSNHIYYDLTFVSQDDELSDSDDETEDVMSSEVDAAKMSFKLKDSDNVETLKKRVAVRLIMPASNIHISFGENELVEEDVIGDLRKSEDGTFQRFTVELSAV
ncbi:uncharacterized protein LOC117117017 [Anneissia japonica]|uniref:uncharacterized protein LOC117117017 n=1 Tax=Anneissia japonica TaxID=1529436 RepID=UPI001425838B|nr:uncharacterized protein LOC117117017 [Anneissia japonica]